jgi:hypothetical protein
LGNGSAKGAFHVVTGELWLNSWYGLRGLYVGDLIAFGIYATEIKLLVQWNQSLAMLRPRPDVQAEASEKTMAVQTLSISHVKAWTEASLLLEYHVPST